MDRLLKRLLPLVNDQCLMPRPFLAIPLMFTGVLMLAVGPWVARQDLSWQ